MCARCCSRGLRHRRHARRAEQSAARPRQLDLRHGRLRRLRRDRRRQAASLRPGHLPLQARRLGAGVPRLDEQQHLGPRLRRDRRDRSTRRPTASIHRYLAIPNRYFESVRGLLGKGTMRMADYRKFHPITAIRQVDFHDGFTAAAGHAVYTARQFPKSYWNRIAFVAEPTGHLVAMCLLDKQGSNFVTHDRFESAGQQRRMDLAHRGRGRSRRRGVGARLVQLHRAAQSDAPRLQDRQGQRLRDAAARQEAWPHLSHRQRIDEGDVEAVNLEKATPEQLVAALKNDNMFWRLQAQWRLVERGKTDVLPALAEIAADAGTNDNGENLPSIHALWAMHGLGAFAKPTHEDGGVALSELAPCLSRCPPRRTGRSAAQRRLGEGNPQGQSAQGSRAARASRRAAGPYRDAALESGRRRHSCGA